MKGLLLCLILAVTASPALADIAPDYDPNVQCEAVAAAKALHPGDMFYRQTRNECLRSEQLGYDWVKENAWRINRQHRDTCLRLAGRNPAMGYYWLYQCMAQFIDSDENAPPFQR